jgi:formylglycine-generating enzyme
VRILVLVLILALPIKGRAIFTPTSRQVKVPGGELKPFWIQPKKVEAKVEPIIIHDFVTMVCPVTNAEFVEFLKRNSEWRRTAIRGVFADQNYLKQFKSDLKLKPGVRSDAPVNNVSWFAARAYCEDAGMRLPSLVEWEYMAAASETVADASKDVDFLNKILEWYGVPQPKSGLLAVGGRSANFYGVHDLHGLVWEWVDDFNSTLITGESRTDGTVNRNMFCGAGGLSGGNKENYAAFMRFAFRSSLKGASTTWNLGFRCVKDVNH